MPKSVPYEDVSMNLEYRGCALPVLAQFDISDDCSNRMNPDFRPQIVFWSGMQQTTLVQLRYDVDASMHYDIDSIRDKIASVDATFERIATKLGLSPPELGALIESCAL